MIVIKQINKISVIGLGALGVLFGHRLSEALPEGSLRIVADRERIEKYKKEGIYCNGEPCSFNYITPEDKCPPTDLLIFAVKYNGLEAAIKTAESQVGPETIIISLLNGISSEEIIGRHFGMEKMIYSVAQGMDAVKVGNRLTYQHPGIICFGDITPGGYPDKVKAVESLFIKTGIPHKVSTDMRKSLWSKLMLNTGVNQTAAVYLCDYAGLQKESTARDVMIAAMKEVMLLSEYEGVNLTEEDIKGWLELLDTLNPDGKPSMQQDIEAGRHSEVELFSGTVLKLGEKHGLNFPINRMLYDKIAEMESMF